MNHDKTLTYEELGKILTYIATGQKEQLRFSGFPNKFPLSIELESGFDKNYKTDTQYIKTMKRLRSVAESLIK